MEILEFFTRNEPIAGLEISDGFLRFVQLKRLKKPGTKIAETQKGDKKFLTHKKYEYRTAVVTAEEEPLEKGVFVGGELVDSEKFVISLQKLIKKTKKASKYVVVSLPPDKIYTKYFVFPSTVGPDKIEDTMKLTTEFQLPFPAGSHYTGWQSVNKENSVVLSSARKETIDKINTALLKAGFSVVAVESSPLSLSRIIREQFANDASAVLINSNDSRTVFVTENNAPKFIRTIPKEAAQDMMDEFRKVVDFYESEFKKAIVVSSYIGEPIKPKKNDMLSSAREASAFFEPYDGLPEAKDGKWFVALGAACRGALKRSEDKLLSLMSVGTNEAYETKKALAFTGFISTLVISISVLMVLIYSGLLFMTIALQRSMNNQIKALSAIPAPVGGTELEARADRLNSMMSRDAEIVRTIPKWSVVVEKLKNSIPSGINLQSVSMPQIDGVFSLSGVASDRTQLKIFKKDLEDSQFFTDVQLPVGNISIRENIPFSMTMRLVDPSSVYFK